MGGPWEDFSPPAASEDGPWNDFKPPAAPSGRDKAMSWADQRLDKTAKGMGYKDAQDQSDSIGRSVMGGQIAKLAGPALSNIAKLMRAPSTVTPALQALNGAPAATEALPGAAEAAYDAAARGGYASADAMSAAANPASAAPATAQAAKTGLLELVKKHPAFSSLLTTGGALALGPEKIWEAIKASPKMAAAATALGIDGNAFGIPGILASKEIVKEATPQSTADAIGGLKGERKFALTGLQNVVAHDPTGMDEQTVERAWASPKIKQLLMQASDLKPGSKAMQNVYSQIQAELKGAKP